MDNLRRPVRHQKSSSIDGFVSKKQNTQAGNIGFERSKEGIKRGSGAPINAFKRADGFYPATQPQITSPRAFEETIDVPYVPPRRKHRKGKFFTNHGPVKWVHTFRHAGWRKRLKMIAIALAVTLVLVGAFLFIKAYLKSRNILQGGGGAAALQEGVDPSLLNVEGDGRINILLLGKGGAGHVAPDLTDTLILISIDPIAHEAGLLSIPRDFYVQTPQDGSMKINSVYAAAKNRVLNSGPRTKQLSEQAELAGLNAVRNSVKDVLGIPVHYRVMVDFEGFRKAIDTVGGVDIDVKQRLYDPTVAWENNYNALIADVGNQHFDGRKALLYSRSRQSSARGDFDRSQRQREVMLALKDKVLSAGTYSNPIKINQLLDAFGNHVRTDFNRNDLPRLYEIMQQIPSSSVKSIGLADPPNDYVTTTNVGGLSVVIPKAGMYEYADIHHYVRNTLKDSFIKNENAEIMILNGSNKPGLARETEKLLKSYGYRIGFVGDAPTKNYPNTILINRRGQDKRYTEHYLQKRLGVSARGDVPSGIDAGTADFVIILGSND